MAERILSRLAERDYEQIIERSFEDFGLEQSGDYGALLLRVADTIANFPFAGTVYVTRKGKRFRRMPSGSHVLFYRDEDQPIQIVRILHMAMDFDHYLDD